MPPRFDLPEEFSVKNAYDTLEKMRLWLSENTADAHTPLEVSAHRVMEIDGAGMQLLAGLGKSGHAWRICEPSSKFVGVCRSLGLEHWLEPTAVQGGAP